MATGPRWQPRILVVIGIVFVVLGALQIAFTDSGRSAYGPMTVGAVAIIVGLVLAKRAARRGRAE